MKKLTVTAAAVWVLLVAGSVFAHHSPVMFDRSKKQTITGTVKEFVWTNPHASIQVEVMNAQGGTDVWGVEMNSPNNLVHEGWKRTSIKAGDKVTVKINPLRDGRPGGRYIGITLADGKYLGGGDTAAAATPGQKKAGTGY